MLRVYSWNLPLLYVVCGLVFAYLVVPLIVIVPISFSSGEGISFPPPGYSTRWYAHYLSDSAWMAATLTSFQVGMLSAALATTLGTLAAIGLLRGSIPFRAAFYGFVLSPIVVPVIVLAVAFYGFFSELGLIGTVIGIALAHSILAAPFVIITVSATLARFDERLEQAAESLGATASQVFFQITLPLIRPAVLTGGLFAFMTSFDEVVIALFLGSSTVQTLPKMMWASMRTGIDPTISAVSVLLIGLSLAVLFGAGAIQWRSERKLGDQR